MPGSIIFKHDVESDIVVAIPKWNINTIKDCEMWYHEWVNYLSGFNRKMDVIMVLDEFNVDENIASDWGEYRSRINLDYIRFSYRINASLSTTIFSKNSAIRYHAPSGTAKNLESAYEAIMSDRKRMLQNGNQ